MKKRSNKTGPTFEIEAGLFRDGCRVIAGADEAGRGSLAGPLAVGLVIFDSSIYESSLCDELSSLDDSKKLSPEKRLLLDRSIRRIAPVVLVEQVPCDVVDRLNPNGATKYALDLLLKKASLKPDCLLMDGTFKFSFPCRYQAVKKGDALSLSIAAASVVAKVARDQLMDSLDPLYPEYGFSVHKGYGTAAHLESIRRCGPSPIHRKSYEPVKSILSGR